MKTGKVTEEQLKDMIGFIRFWLDEGGVTGDVALSTLVHDLGGLYRKDKCFLPRTSGYGKYAEKYEKAVRT